LGSEKARQFFKRILAEIKLRVNNTMQGAKKYVFEKFSKTQNG